MKVPLGAVTTDEWRALDTASVCLVRHDARFRLTGPGRVACLQGLVTSDVEKLAEGAAAFGAVLTPKGMVLTPVWIIRHSDSLVVEAPLAARTELAGIFAKSLPPRLCRAEDLTEATRTVGAYGPGAAAFAPPGSVPAVARGAPGYEWLVLEQDAAAAVVGLEQRGVRAASEMLMEAARILAGVPALGAEIGARTLPQEARFEELGALSFTKGCYVGQETVARLHFRGHANRGLALLLCDSEPAVPAELTHEGKVAGSLTSAAYSPDLDAWAGQAILRIEVEDGAEVSAGDLRAVVRRGRWPREPQ
jgi:folate-binding protein YgfZ